VETEKREIVLQGLSPGNYELEIQVALDPTFKRVRVVRQTFEIRKPFYTTWWFVLLVTLGLILLMRQILAWREQKRMLQNQAEKEKIRAQYEILKSQISPHFLFNAFNTLSQLIDVDSQKASKYVDQLALVFRKVLHFRDQELISLREEMSLVEAYIHLQQQRFESKLRVSIQIPEAAFELLVVPMSIQLLVENAVKHNVISSTKPLSISLLVKGETIIVQNNLQPKKQPEPSTGFGLSSLQSRYRQDLGQMLQIERDDQYFTVTLPLLQPNP
jgi:LytS/YehU family sensor histidine kinase